MGTHAMNLYRHDLEGVLQLDRATERALAVEWRNGNRAAGEKLVRACLPFVIRIAMEYRRWGIAFDDIVQQGNLGLLKAVAKFDPSHDCRLATYAAYWIRAEIREYVVRGYRVVRLGTTKGERKVLRAYRTHPETEVATLAELSGLSVERVQALLPILKMRESSLDAAVGDAVSLENRLPSDNPTPEDETGSREEASLRHAAVDVALRELDTREQLIARERLMNEEPQTLEQLGKLLGVSKERVRQIEVRVRGKLRVGLQGFAAA